MEIQRIELPIQNVERIYLQLMSKIILNNNIVSTIIYNLGRHFAKYKVNLDKQLNTDI
jgi:hypothetical protein